MDIPEATEIPEPEKTITRCALRATSSSIVQRVRRSCSCFESVPLLRLLLRTCDVWKGGGSQGPGVVHAE